VLRLRDGSLDRHSRASEQDRDDRDRNTGQAEPLAPSEDDAEQAQHEADDDDGLNQCSNQAHRIDRAKLGRGEPGREEQAEHGAESHRTENDGGDAADPTGAERARFALFHPPAPGRPVFRRSLLDDERTPLTADSFESVGSRSPSAKIRWLKADIAALCITDRTFHGSPGTRASG